MKICGIYKIINRTNGKYYVGSSNDIKCRWSSHKNKLNKNLHENSHLQRSWNKHGSDNFDFVIVEKTPTEKLTEQYYLNIAKNERKNCYNTSFIVGNPPELSEEQKLIKNSKISNSVRKCWKNKQIRHRYSQSRINYFKNYDNRKKASIITKLALSNPLIRKKMSNGKKCKMIYSFQNTKTGETFSGMILDFRTKYNLDAGSVSSVIHKKRKSTDGWILL